MANHILNINQLNVTLHLEAKKICAINGLSFAIGQGETFALIGESGCGKSLTALSILQLLPNVATIDRHSQISFCQHNLLRCSEIQMRKIRGGEMGIIFQEPTTAMNPVFTVGEQIGEVLAAHMHLKGEARRLRTLELLTQVGIPEPKQRILAYPHQLSGGMKQRVMIAIALAGQPDLLIADEPTTALDVTTQAEIIDLLAQLQQQSNMSILMISHDLAVVKGMANRIGIMYAGHIVEQASAQRFFSHPLHPYSQMLFDSLPNIEKKGQPLATIKGSVPTMTEVREACRFADRCSFVMDKCRQRAPGWYKMADGHHVRCFLYETNHEQTKRNSQFISGTQRPLGQDEVNKETQDLLKLEDVHVHFPIKRGILKRVVGQVKAVNGVNLQLRKGEILALVGESGCGKTTLARAILQLEMVTKGKIIFQNQDITSSSKAALKDLYRQIQIVFQDPFASMDPRMLVGDIIIEGMVAHRIEDNNQKRYQVAKKLLRQVGLPEESIYRYPHEFSGGQRQRISIARTLAIKPIMIICDEPTSALDVSVQAQILNLFKSLQHQYDLSYLFITHNLAVVAYLADRIAIMYRGKIVEYGNSRQILAAPEHPYTKKLLAAVPII